MNGRTMNRTNRDTPETSTDHPSEPFIWPSESDWTDPLRDVLASRTFRDLETFLAEERRAHTIYPSAEDVFAALRLTPLAQVRAVILGQDPYHQPGQAHGLAFSVRDGTRLPPSLRNIFREMADDIGPPDPPASFSGDLTHWARQGVLLLNRVLTVRHNQAGSHQRRGWETFTDAVIRAVIHQDNPVAFVLWGKAAAELKPLIRSPHAVFESPHPSPLSAYRGFFGSRPFSRINEFLISHRLTPIQWAESH